MCLQGGGAERVLALVTAELASRGHEVTIASFDAEGGASFYPLGNDVQWVQLGEGKPHRSTTVMEMITRIGAIKRLLRLLQPDVLVSFMHSSFVPGSVAARLAGVNHVASEHIVISYYRKLPVQRLLQYIATLLSKKITAVSEQARSLYSERTQKKVVVIPNPVESMPVDKHSRPGGEPTRQVILAVGRLEAQKDHATLIKAFASLASAHPEWHLRIVGDGSLRDELEGLVRELGLGSRVELPGASARVSEEYAAASIFVTPSLFESFGLVTAEAMGAGLPAIGFKDCPGTNDLIENDVNGLLVESRDRVKGLAAAIARLIESPAHRVKLAENGRHILEQYGVETVTDKWEQLLADVA